MNTDNLLEGLMYTSWFNNSLFPNIFSQSYTLYRQLKNPKFKVFYRYTDTNLSFPMYMFCIGAAYFKKTMHGPYLVFLNTEKDNTHVNGWSVMVPEDRRWTWNKVVDPVYMDCPFLQLSNADFLQNFTENFTFKK